MSSWPSAVPPIEDSVARINALMVRLDAPFDCPDPAPLCEGEWERNFGDRPCPEGVAEFLSAPPRLPWATSFHAFSSWYGFDAVVIGRREDGWRASVMVCDVESDTFPVLGNPKAEPPGLLFPSLRSGLWLWAETLERAADLLDSGDRDSWFWIPYAWYNAWAHSGPDWHDFPSGLWGPLSEASRWMLETERQAGCLDGFDFTDLIAEGQKLGLWPPDWVS